MEEQKCQQCGQEKEEYAILEEKLLKTELISNLSRAAQDITLMEVTSPVVSTRRNKTLENLFDSIDALVGEL